MEVIMIVRLQAMYQRSRIMLIFLVIVFLVVYIACGVLTAMGLSYTVTGK
jgi:predicted RND superfamily exporter protein